MYWPLIIIYALFFGITGVALFKGVPVFLSELRGFDDEIASYAAMYHNQMDHLYHTTPEVTHDHFNRVIAKAELGLKHFIGKIVAFLTWMFQSFFTLLIIPFLAFYFLKDVNGIKKKDAAGLSRASGGKKRSIFSGIWISLSAAISEDNCMYAPFFP
ncbi:hypothetical protein QS257_08380 [Terrilactibacillus sp. S3-3]|nr:hypothetical protein QS257_08380 [Terrilactibacillus sp. S3-3]